MSDTNAALRRNTRLLYLNSFFEYSFYIDAIYYLFGTHNLHLTYFQAGSLFFVGWFAGIFFDFLGGVVADATSRKQTQMFGLALQAAAFVPYLFTKSYMVLVIANFFWGIGLALTSNTLQAIVYEQAVELGQEETYQKMSAITQVWLFAGLASSSLIGGLVYSYNPVLPYGLTISALLAALLVSSRIRVPEKVERKLIEKHHPRNIARTALHTFRANRQLRYFVIVSFFAGVCSDMLFSYYQPYYLKLHVTALTLGVIFASIRLVSALGSFTMRKLPDVFSLPAIQLIQIVSIICTAAMMVAFKLPVVLAAPLIVAVTSGFIEPAMRLFVNRHADNTARTATLSFASGIMNFGVGLGFVVASYVADKFSSNTILAIILGLTGGTILLSLMTVRLKETKFSNVQNAN